MSVKHNTSGLIKRIQEKINALNLTSDKVRAAFTRIGVLVTAQAKINIRRQGLIDTGRLINSIRFEVFQTEEKAVLRIGSFGVPYAAAHEFGFRETVTVREHTRMMSKAFGKDISPREVRVGQHTMQMKVKKKPYLNPAVRKFTPDIVNMLRGLMA